MTETPAAAGGPADPVGPAEADASEGPPPADVPDGLRHWVRDRLDGPGDTAARGLMALDRARALPGTEREGAWWLLAADALLTTAADEALDAEDPETALGRLILDAAAAER